MTDTLYLLFAVTVLYAAVASRMATYIRVLVVQGCISFAILLLDMLSPGNAHPGSLVFLVVETMAVKTVTVPLFLRWIIRRTETAREADAHRPHFRSLLFTCALFAFSFAVAFSVRGFARAVEPVGFGVAIGAIMGGLYFVVARKKLVTHVVAFLVMENGITLLSASVAREMPFTVNLGMLLDVFLLVLTLGIFVHRVSTRYDGERVDHLAELKD